MLNIIAAASVNRQAGGWALEGYRFGQRRVNLRNSIRSGIIIRKGDRFWPPVEGEGAIDSIQPIINGLQTSVSNGRISGNIDSAVAVISKGIGHVGERRTLLKNERISAANIGGAAVIDNLHRKIP